MHTSALTRDLFISDNAVCVCACLRVQTVRSQDLGLIFFCGSCNCMRWSGLALLSDANVNAPDCWLMRV